MVKPISANGRSTSAQSAPARSAPRVRGDSVVSRLKRDLLLGRYQAGDRLPPERELAARLGTNRNTLREALRTLEADNLVRSRQGDGTLVLDWRATAEINLLPSFLAERTPADERFEAMITLLNLRGRVMEEAIGRATISGSPEDMEAIDAALHELEQAEPGIPLVRADVELYRRIALASHSLVVIWTFNTFARIFLELGERFPEAWSNDATYLSSLSRVVRWLRERRADRAREEMRLIFEQRGMALAGVLNPDGPVTDRPRRKKSARG